FATTAALAVLLGTISQAAFAVAYARVAVRAGWPVATAAGCAVFALSTIGFQRLSLPALPAFALVTASLILATILMPKSRPGARPQPNRHRTLIRARDRNGARDPGIDPSGDPRRRRQRATLKVSLREAPVGQSDDRDQPANDPREIDPGQRRIGEEGVPGPRP